LSGCSGVWRGCYVGGLLAHFACALCSRFVSFALRVRSSGCQRVHARAMEGGGTPTEAAAKALQAATRSANAAQKTAAAAAAAAAGGGAGGGGGGATTGATPAGTAGGAPKAAKAAGLFGGGGSKPFPRALLEELFGPTLLASPGGDSAAVAERPTAEALAGARAVGIYFSAHWCPPCRAFTPQFARLHAAALKQQGLEVVFASADKEQAAFDEYYGAAEGMSEAGFAALPFKNRCIIAAALPPCFITCITY
jgi:thiol-disulfide isomerase/thioredoxin